MIIQDPSLRGVEFGGGENAFVLEGFERAQLGCGRQQTANISMNSLVASFNNGQRTFEQ